MCNGESCEPSAILSDGLSELFTRVPGATGRDCEGLLLQYLRTMQSAFDLSRVRCVFRGSEDNFHRGAGVADGGSYGGRGSNLGLRRFYGVETWHAVEEVLASSGASSGEIGEDLLRIAQLRNGGIDGAEWTGECDGVGDTSGLVFCGGHKGKVDSGVSSGGQVGCGGAESMAVSDTAELARVSDLRVRSEVSRPVVDTGRVDDRGLCGKGSAGGVGGLDAAGLRSVDVDGVASSPVVSVGRHAQKNRKRRMRERSFRAEMKKMLGRGNHGGSLGTVLDKAGLERTDVDVSGGNDGSVDSGSPVAASGTKLDVEICAGMNGVGLSGSVESSNGTEDVVTVASPVNSKDAVGCAKEIMMQAEESALAVEGKLRGETVEVAGIDNEAVDDEPIPYIGTDGVVYGRGKADAERHGAAGDKSAAIAAKVRDAAAGKRFYNRHKFEKKEEKEKVEEAKGIKSDVPEWRRHADPDGVPRPGRKAYDPVSSTGRFFSVCGPDTQRELAESRAKRFIAENNLKAIEAESKARQQNDKYCIAMRSVAVRLKAAEQLRKVATTERVSGWVETIASKSVEDLSGSLPSGVPTLECDDSIKLGESANKQVGSSPVSAARKAEYLKRKAEIDHYYDTVEAYWPEAQTADYDQLKADFIDVVGSFDEKTEYALRDRLKQIMEDNPDIPPDHFRMILDKLDVVENYDYYY